MPQPPPWTTGGRLVELLGRPERSKIKQNKIKPFFWSGVIYVIILLNSPITKYSHYTVEGLKIVEYKKVVKRNLVSL